MPVTGTSWRRIPFASGHPVPYHAAFSPEEVNRLEAGLRPREMEDKWFIYFEEPCLYLHRSWTGQPVYRLKLIDMGQRDGPGYLGARVDEALWCDTIGQVCCFGGN